MPTRHAHALLGGLAAVLIAALLTTVGGVAGAAASSTSPIDRTYLRMSMQADRFEIAAGRIAEARAQRGDVRSLATTLIRDHNRSLATKARLAGRLGVAVPRTPGLVQNWILDELQTLPPANIDRRYTALEVADHAEGIDMATAAAREAHDSRVRAVARDDLTMLRSHLAAVRQVRAAMFPGEGGGGSGPLTTVPGSGSGSTTSTTAPGSTASPGATTTTTRPGSTASPNATTTTTRPGSTATP
jgi:predicted outer membrane protein